MSYGIGLCVKSEDLDNPQIDVCIVDWCLTVQFKITPPTTEIIKKLRNEWFADPNFKNVETKKLRSAPCDVVVILHNDGTWSSMGNRHPLDCSKGSGNEKLSDLKIFFK